MPRSPRDDVAVNERQAPAISWHPDVDVSGVIYSRAVVRTPWIKPGDDLGAILARELSPILQQGDLAIVSEKAVTIAEGLTVPAESVHPSPLAKRLAGYVRPTAGSCGLSIPEKMEYVLRQVGLPRIMLATATAAVTRPLGIRGGFYVVAGAAARAMDGMRPPFEDTLIPPLSARRAASLARSLADQLGSPVAIVDMNDRGGSIRSMSHPVMSRRRLRRVLADNPLGQRDERTPIGVVRPALFSVAAAPARNSSRQLVSYRTQSG
jgi:F420-0:gamma-glutamyl ligase